MYGLIGKMTVAPGTRNEVIAALLEGVQAMPGCLSYVVAEDPADADAIWVTEVWDGKDSHANSLKLPAVQQAIARARPHITGFAQHVETVPVGGHGLAPSAGGQPAVTNAPCIHRLDDAEADAEAEHYFLAPEKLISGNPRQSVWTQYADPSGRFFAGTWASEVGKWSIRYTEEEECRILEGVSIITDAQDQAVTVRAGDRFVIPRGFAGTWEVVEPTRKTFVVYEPGG